ncbi:MAG: TetR/AcrR family transcriptional regulator [Bacillus sp. (in: firmicutes)]
MEDRRIRYTKKVIKEAFIGLLEQKPINKITVTELCEQCEINRATFYRYYKDVYDLLDKLKYQFVSELKAAISTSKDDYTISGFTEEILEVILNNKELSRILFSLKNGKDFLDDVLEIAHKKCVEKWTRSGKNVPERQIAYLSTFISAGTIGVLDEWIQSDFRESPVEIAGLIESISHYGIAKIIYRK